MNMVKTCRERSDAGNEKGCWGTHEGAYDTIAELNEENVRRSDAVVQKLRKGGGASDPERNSAQERKMERPRQTRWD